MNCLTSHSETARQAGAGAPLQACPNLFLVRDGATDLAGGFAKSVNNIRNKAPNSGRIVLVGVGGGIAVPFIFWTFHGDDL